MLYFIFCRSVWSGVFDLEDVSLKAQQTMNDDIFSVYILYIYYILYRRPLRTPAGCYKPNILSFEFGNQCEYVNVWVLLQHPCNYGFSVSLGVPYTL